MKRLLCVSGDREWTAAIADGLAKNDDWETARAHSGLEAFVLLDRGNRPFDALMVDTPLPDQNVLALMNRVRRSDAGLALPVYLLTERGRDAQVRRMVAESFGTTRFIDKPASVETLREQLRGLKAKLRVLIAEGDATTRGRYADVLMDAGYDVESMATGRQAIERQPRLRPSAVVCNLRLPDLTGLTVCSHVRKAAVTPTARVVLYGQLSALTAQTAHNDERADDFIAAPFDDEMLVERLAALIGRTHHRRWRRSSPVPPTEDLPKERPPSKDRRHHRRIGCRVQVLVQGDGRRFQTEAFDLSAGGLFLAIDAPIPTGTPLELTIDLRDRQGLIRTDCTVAWIGHTGPKRGFGVRFVDVDPEVDRRLRAHVAQVGQVVYDP